MLRCGWLSLRFRLCESIGLADIARHEQELTTYALAD